MEQKEKQALFDRAEDMLRRTARGEVTRSRFLTPAEAHALSAYLERQGHTKDCFFYGGYAGAERTRLFLLPGYLTDFMGADTERDFSFEEPEPDEHTVEGYPVGLIDSYTDGAVTEAVTALSVKGSGYRDLSHRDYLGSILSLGVERDVLGDIVTDGTFDAVLFCDGKIAPYLLANLKRVANDTVKVTPYEVPKGFSGNRKTVPISDTVASKRLDCVVAALTNASREAAQELIHGGCCEVDFETEYKNDRMLDAPVQISVRGFGRYRLCAFDGETKKGRLRMRAEKYV